MKMGDIYKFVVKKSIPVSWAGGGDFTHIKVGLAWNYGTGPGQTHYLRMIAERRGN